MKKEEEALPDGMVPLPELQRCDGSGYKVHGESDKEEALHPLPPQFHEDDCIWCVVKERGDETQEGEVRDEEDLDAIFLFALCLSVWKAEKGLILIFDRILK